MNKEPTSLQQFFDVAFQKHTLLRSLRIALSVGTVYNLINQGDVLLSAGFAGLNYVKITLTYMTPLLVATYASASTQLKMSKYRS